VSRISNLESRISGVEEIAARKSQAEAISREFAKLRDRDAERMA